MKFYLPSYTKYFVYFILLCSYLFSIFKSIFNRKNTVLVIE